MSTIHTTVSGALEAIDTIFNKFRVARGTHTVTVPEATAHVFQLTLLWGTPFPDLNYTVVLAVAPSNTSVDKYSINSFTKTVNGVTVSVNVQGGAGDNMELHAVAIHD